MSEQSYIALVERIESEAKWGMKASSGHKNGTNCNARKALAIILGLVHQGRYPVENVTSGAGLAEAKEERDAKRT